jgi:hypothetical protein
LWRHDVEGIQPPEPGRDEGLHRGIGGPHVELLPPQRIREAHAIEARACIFEWDLEWS